MEQNRQIKLLTLEGITPNVQTIENGAYPLASDFYAATVEGKETENTQKLIKWILLPQGQSLVEKTGYTPIC